MPPEEIIERLAAGFAELFTRDGELFDLGLHGVHEQTITFRLGFYLQSLFATHHVDCEYNRVWDQTKGCELTGIDSMKPDVIVHRRTCDAENLVCIEAKKHNLWNDPDIGYASIERKLVALTRLDGVYRYPVGLAWQIMPTLNRAEHSVFWFTQGQQFHASCLVNFEARLLHALRAFDALRSSRRSSPSRPEG